MQEKQQIQLYAEHGDDYYYYNDDLNAIYDVFELFNYYNVVFFGGILQRCSLRWTNKMTRCAGTCTYQGFGSCVIALSQPLLKFRTSNQVKETLLHQMIHAFLFITDPQSCKIDEGHGPKFKQLMYKINKITKLSITVYHSFHNEVSFHKKHIWRCDGPCKQKPPFYGYVKRAMNRKPQPADHWFKNHQRVCGGNFIKIQGGPEKNSKSKSKGGNSKHSKSLQKIIGTSKQKSSEKQPKKKKQPKRWASGGKTIQQYLQQMAQEQKKRKSVEKNK